MSKTRLRRAWLAAAASLIASMAVLPPLVNAQEQTTPENAITDTSTSPDLLPSGAMPLPPSAEGFRIHFDRLLQEHTYLAGAMTDNLINGRREEYLVTQGMLQSNSVALARVIGALYGPANEARFLQGWNRHIQDYETYAQGAMIGSEPQKQQARADLDAYVAEARAFLLQLNPAAPADPFSAALSDHEHGTLEVIDAQAAKDLTRAFTLGRQGTMMTAMNLADPWAAGIVRQFPERFTGDVEDPDAGFRRQVTLLVHADTMLSGAELSAVVMGRQPEVDAVNRVLEQNTSELTNAIGARAHNGAPDRFSALWRDHHAALLDYARAVPGNDVSARQQAMQRLDTFRANFEALFAPGLGLSDRFVPHAVYVTSALDALGMHDIGTAKALEGGASKQSEEIGMRLALAAAGSGATEPGQLR